ncbi:MAG TPA: MFS transporter [Gammaproteobacteria bacterium]|nr:MFS transporter [Gammaproteobacteria bacterium]
MATLIGRLFGLLLGITILLTGMGLLGSLLGLRATEAHFPGWELGLVMSGYFAGFIVGSFLCPVLIRRVGPIRSFAAFAAIVASATLAHALAVNPWSWLALRLVTGTAMVGLYMVTESWLNASLPRPYRVQIFSFYAMLTLVAMAAGQFLFFAVPANGTALFLVAGMLIVAGLIPVTATRLDQPPAVSAPRLPPLDLLRRAPFAVAGTFLSGLTTGAFWGLGAAFAARLGFSPGQIGLFVACTVAGGIVAQWPLGRLSDRVGRPPVMIAAAALGCVFALLLAAATQGPEWPLLIFGFGFGAMALCLYALAVAHMNDVLEPPEVLSATQGLLLATGVGSMLGPLIAGMMFDAAGARGLPLYLAAVLAIFALSGLLYSLRRVMPRPREQSEFVPMVRTSQVALEIVEESRGPQPGGP